MDLAPFMLIHGGLCHNVSSFSTILFSIILFVVVLFWLSQSYLHSPIWSCAGKGDQPTTTVKEDSVFSNKSVPHKSKYSLSSISCFGVDLTPDNIAVAMVYFVQGVLGLSRLAVSFYLKDDLHLDPAEVCHPDRVIYFQLFVNLPSGTNSFLFKLQILAKSAFSIFFWIWESNCHTEFKSCFGI